MTNAISLTELEQKVIKAISQGDDFNDMPTLCFEDIKDYTGIAPKQLRGVLSSLFQKDLLSEGEYPNGLKAFHLKPQELGIAEKRIAVLNHFINKDDNEDLLEKMGFKGNEQEHLYGDVVEDRVKNRDYIFNKLTHQYSDNEIAAYFDDLELK